MYHSIQVANLDLLQPHETECETNSELSLPDGYPDMVIVYKGNGVEIASFPVNTFSRALCADEDNPSIYIVANIISYDRSIYCPEIDDVALITAELQTSDSEEYPICDYTYPGGLFDCTYFEETSSVCFPDDPGGSSNEVCDNSTLSTFVVESYDCLACPYTGYGFEKFDFDEDGCTDMICLREKLLDGSLSEDLDISNIIWSSPDGEVLGSSTCLNVEDDNLDEYYGELITVVFQYWDNDTLVDVSLTFNLPICDNDLSENCANEFFTEQFDWNDDGCTDMICIREILPNGSVSSNVDIFDINWSAMSGDIPGPTNGVCLTEANNTLSDYNGQTIFATFNYDDYHKIPCSAEISVVLPSCSHADDAGSGRGDENSTNKVGEITFHPNPSNGIFNMINNSEKQINIKVMNLDGKVIFKDAKGSANSKLSFDLSGYPPGVYFVELSTREQKEFRKIILEE